MRCRHACSGTGSCGDSCGILRPNAMCGRPALSCGPHSCRRRRRWFSVRGIKKSRHSCRSMPRNRSQSALAWGLRTGVLSSLNPRWRMRRSSSWEKLASRSWIRKRYTCSAAIVSRSGCIVRALWQLLQHGAWPHAQAQLQQEFVGKSWKSMGCSGFWTPRWPVLIHPA